MKERLCRRCENPVRDAQARSCGVCGLGEPDLETPLAVRLTLALDIPLILLMLAVAGISFAAIPSIGLIEDARVDAAMETLYTPYIPLAFGAVSAILLLVAAVGVGKGRTWGRRLQDSVGWIWFLAGVNLALWNAIRAPEDLTAELALWGLAALTAFAGGAWMVFVARPRPRQWFRTMEKFRGQAY